MTKKKSTSSHVKVGFDTASKDDLKKSDMISGGTDAGEEKEDDTEEEEMVYLQVDTGDIVKLKQVLDEAVAGSVIQMTRIDGTQANAVNLPENLRNENLKLILMALACSFALIAQFAPLPFPEKRVWVGFFCALYFVISGILQYIITYIDKDSIFDTKPLNVAKDKKVLKNSKMAQYGLRFRSSLPRFSEFYTVTIEFQGMENSPFVQQKWSVGKFFDGDGMFDECGLAEEIVKLYRRFESCNYDSLVSAPKQKTS